jgi:hypothetical protein
MLVIHFLSVLLIAEGGRQNFRHGTAILHKLAIAVVKKSASATCHGPVMPLFDNSASYIIVTTW